MQGLIRHGSASRLHGRAAFWLGMEGMEDMEGVEGMENKEKSKPCRPSSIVHPARFGL